MLEPGYLTLYSHWSRVRCRSTTPPISSLRMRPSDMQCSAASRWQLLRLKKLRDQRKTLRESSLRAASSSLSKLALKCSTHGVKPKDGRGPFGQGFGTCTDISRMAANPRTMHLPPALRLQIFSSTEACRALFAIWQSTRVGNRPTPATHAAMSDERTAHTCTCPSQ